MAKNSDILVSNTAARQITVELVQGNILDVEAQAYVVGIYEGVKPGGAAEAIDSVINDKIIRAFGTGMFSGRQGEIYFLPCPRTGLLADYVILAGLGNVNELLSPDNDSDNPYHRQELALQLVGVNLVRAMISSNVSHAATVLMGTSTGLSSSKIVQNLTSGIVKTVRAEDRQEIVKKITIVEYDDTKYSKMVRNVRELVTQEIPEGMNVRLTANKLESTDRWKGFAKKRGGGQFPIYLFTRGERTEDDGLLIKYVVLGAKSEAALFERSKFVSMAKIDQQIARLSDKNIDEVGKKICAMVLPEETATALRKTDEGNSPIVVVNDPATAFIPWEILKIQTTIPSLKNGMSRLLRAQPNLGRNNTRRNRGQKKTRMLLITDPTHDLQGARDEAEKLKALLSNQKNLIEYFEIGNRKLHASNPEATKERILSEMHSGNYDIVHYGGHAFFDPQDRSKSGLIAHKNKNITKEDILGSTELPKVFFFNACESGRVRKTSKGVFNLSDKKTLDKKRSIERNVSLAETVITSGISHYIGTYWPVGDDAAKIFSGVFYKNVLNGVSVGESIRLSRQALRAKKNYDWADYIHYGDPFSVLFETV